MVATSDATLIDGHTTIESKKVKVKKSRNVRRDPDRWTQFLCLVVDSDQIVATSDATLIDGHSIEVNANLR